MGSNRSASRTIDHHAASEQLRRWCGSADSSPPGEHDTTVQMWEQLAGRVSSAAMRARSLRSRHDRDPLLSVELDALIVELDGAFTAVMRSGAQQPPATATVRSGSRSEQPEDATQHRFCRWVSAHCPAVLTSDDEHPAPAAVDPESLLGSLTGVDRPVPRPIAAILALPAGASYAAGVGRLRWARHSTDGPRCRSYRSACLFLADADIDLLPLPTTTPQDHGSTDNTADSELRSTTPSPVRARA